MSERWYVNPQTPNTIITPDGRITVAWVHSPAENPYRLAEETAAKVVRAVNAHDALVAACEWMRTSMAELVRDGGGHYDEPAAQHDLDMLDAALALAKP